MLTPLLRAPLDDYLASLPDGLRSFPGAMVRGNVMDEQVQWLEEADVRIDPRLEAALRAARPLGRSPDWLPEVLSNALSLNARAGYVSDAAWIRAVYERQRRVYRTAGYRAMMLVLSPTLLMMGARQRWGAYRRGSSLEVGRWHKDGRSMRSQGTLVYPPGLHTPLMLRGFCSTLQAAIDAAGAKDSTCELLAEESKPGEARYLMTYAA